MSDRPNIYAGSPVDRLSNRREDADWIAAMLRDPDSRFVPVWRGKTLLRGAGAADCAAAYLTAAQLDARWTDWVFLGVDGGRAIFAIDTGDSDSPPALAPDQGARFEDLRQLGGSLPGADAAILAHARGMIYWRQRHRFCGVCGTVCAPQQAGNMMLCPQCDAHHFPRTDPAVIMLVLRGDSALLAHSQRFPSTIMYSTLAGFVEPGESLEEAVAREVFEETGVRVGGVRYHSSQPWPFPASIMLGFYADAVTDQITIDPKEIRDARWFTRDEIRNCDRHGFQLPRTDSIARRLIEDWIKT